MRKDYEKPALYAETFQLVEHIADQCNTVGGFSAQHSSPWTCAVTNDSEVMFTNEVGACASGIEYDAEIMKMDGFMDTIQLGSQCYNIPESGPMFSS